MRKKINLGILVLLGFLGSLVTPLSAQTTEMETRYKDLAARFEGRDKLLQRDLKAYLQAFPYTTFVDEVRFMQGVLLVEKGRYKNSLKTLEKVDISALTRPHQEDYSFYRGYAYLMMQDYQRAQIYFAQLAKGKSRYTVRGNYYYGYCHYKMGNYDKALPAFQTLENEPAYAKSIPYFLTQIAYVSGQYDEAEQRANALLAEHPESENNVELHRMLGELAFQKKEYGQAAEHLRFYAGWAAQQKETPVRNDLFMLGTAEFQLGNYEQAVKVLKQMKLDPDTLSEAACMTMGNAYVKLEQIEQAKLSYQAAASYGLTSAVKEEAAYNYTLCTYQSSSALGESVKAFNDFLRQFPKSKYEKTLYQLLSDALMQSKNYAAALSTLDSINSPSKNMLQIKQYLRYQLGADRFLQGKMQDAANWMTEVINHTAESSKYTTEAYYLRAESNYRLRHYPQSEQDVNTFFNRPDAKQSKNYVIARYLQGYAYFSQTKYDKAREAFSLYIDKAQPQEPTYADALNRIGDCYFNARDFQAANTYYSQVSALEATGSDYSLFQRGYALGLQHKYADKITVMRDLVTRYPKSDFADDGLYEIARAQLQLEDENGAIVTYEEMLKAYPHSSLARKASLERAMIYRNLGQREQAIKAYRHTIDKYPSSEEAYTALEALQAMYVESGDVNEYLNYTKQLAKKNMKVSTQEDSLLFAAAEMQYMQAAYTKAAEAFDDYIAKFCPGGRYCTTARYYLADSYYRLGKNDAALTQYKVLAEMNANPYQEEANTRVAELCYDKADYSCALDAFYRMQSMASNRENMAVARLGILRCTQALDKYQEAIDIAQQILNDTPLSNETKKEAMYGRAKAYIGMGNWIDAQPDLAALSVDVRTAQGAEAKYLLAQSYFELQLLNEAEEEIMSFTQANTQQQYWLARALILLSDINRVRNELFQARQYLLVLQQNYRLKGDDIPALIQDRLAQLDVIENPVEKEEQDDEE